MSSKNLIDPVLSDVPLCTVKGVTHRVRSIMSALEKETWLPIALRSMAVEGFMSIQNEVNEFGLDISELTLQVNSIAYALFSYEDRLTESEVCLLYTSPSPRD